MNQSLESARVEPKAKSYIIHFAHPDNNCRQAGETASISVEARTKKEALGKAQSEHVACPCGAYYKLSETLS